MTALDKKYFSRKWIITLGILTATIVLAMIGKMSSDVATIFTGLGATYNAAQGYVDSRQ